MPVMCPGPGPVLEYARQLFCQLPASGPINLAFFPLVSKANLPTSFRSHLPLSVFKDFTPEILSFSCTLKFPSLLNDSQHYTFHLKKQTNKKLSRFYFFLQNTPPPLFLYNKIPEKNCLYWFFPLLHQFLFTFELTQIRLLSPPFHLPIPLCCQIQR